MSVITSTADIKEQLRERIPEMREELTRAEEALKVLEGARAALPTTRPTPRATARRNSSRSKLTPEAVLEAMHGMEAPVRSPELAQIFRTTPGAVLNQLRKLEKNGLVKREGERAQTHWMPQP